MPSRAANHYADWSTRRCLEKATMLTIFWDILIHEASLLHSVYWPLSTLLFLPYYCLCSPPFISSLFALEHTTFLRVFITKMRLLGHLSQCLFVINSAYFFMKMHLVIQLPSEETSAWTVKLGSWLKMTGNGPISMKLWPFIGHGHNESCLEYWSQSSGNSTASAPNSNGDCRGIRTATCSFRSGLTTKS